MDFFDEAFDYLMDDEKKVITRTEGDAGGLTNWGITKAAYEDFLKHKVSDAYFESLTLDCKKFFYSVKYWQALFCHALSKKAIAIAIFDTGVLYGVKTTALLAQKTADICGCAITIDGAMGPQSAHFIDAIEPDFFLDSFRATILSRIDTVILQNPNDEKFRKGWTNRADRLLTLQT